MKKILIVFSLMFSIFVFSQNEQLAQNYFDKGDFEKALISYQELIKGTPSNGFYYMRIVECEQQLLQFDKAEKDIQDRLEKYKQANLLVELGYNYQLQKDENKAKKYYDQAIDRIKKNKSEVYSIGPTFEKKVLVDYALLAYQTATDLDPKLNFNFQMALLYGQQGNTELMVNKFLDESYNNPPNLQAIQNQLSRFMTEDSQESFNDQLKKALLLRAQKSQEIFWNQYLSWFFVQQKEFGKAFIQEKSIYKRNPESFANIVNLAQLSIEEEDQETAKEIFGFILENTLDIDLKIQANYYLEKIKIDSATQKDYPAITLELENLIKQFGVSPYSLSLQKLQAHFVTFNLQNPEQGKIILKTALDLPLNQFQIADVKMELADTLLFQEKFNQALIYYSQIEDDLKNDEVGHQASLKIAKTSYFQTDFVWASKQLKTLKSASTQLIANDAIDLFLLINDNTVADSTQTALKKFAHADFLLYQNKTQDALAVFQQILKDHKTEEIEPVTLYRIGKIYEKQGDFTSALSQYQKIIDNYKECIYIDEANYFSAEIYNKQLKDVEKAKKYYEEVIFHHEDSIYFTDARRKYRQLRGDKDI
jgi:tetratricopeptide (TPR) repeat protein